MSGPLHGIRVFDLTNAGVGPIATELLGGLGADVIKVESPEGDVMRTMQPRQRGFPTAYTSHNFNKRAIVLDLKEHAGREHAYDLLKTCDIFVENFRPGVAARLGVDYPTVASVNSAIIYISSSAWGNRGPMRYFAGVDPNLQAFSGWSSIIGAPEEGGEFHRGYGHLDATTASYIASAALQALLARQRTGKGTYIEIAMLAAALNLQVTRVAEFFAGQPPKALGSAANWTAPNEAFKCQNGKYLAVGVETDEQWQGLCNAVRRTDLIADTRFATPPARLQHRAELADTLAPIFLALPSIWWTKELTRFAVPNSLFHDFEELREHAHVVSNRLLLQVEVPHQGPVTTSAFPWQFNGSSPSVLAAPAPDQHTAEVLAEVAAASAPVEMRTA